MSTRLISVWQYQRHERALLHVICREMRIDERLQDSTDVNEFYKKGCQEKKLRLDRNRDLILDIQPTSYMPRWRSFAFLFS